MPGPAYYRRQAHICAGLALSASDPNLRARYNTMALEHLARAEPSEESSFDKVPPRNMDCDWRM